MGHEQEGDALAAEIVLEPLYHFDVEVVGRLVEDQEVGLLKEHLHEGCPLQLAAGKGVHRLGEVSDAELMEHAFGTSRSVEVVGGEWLGCSEVEDGLPFPKGLGLGEVADARAPLEDHRAGVGRLDAGDDVEER